MLFGLSCRGLSTAPNHGANAAVAFPTTTKTTKKILA